MAIKLFYPMGKCEEQIIARKEESRIFIALLLNNLREFIDEHPDLFLNLQFKVSSDYNCYKDDYFDYVKTISNDSGIIRRIGFSLYMKDEMVVIDVCEYRLNEIKILSKLLGRLYYNQKTSEIIVSSLKYFNSLSDGICLARIPMKESLKEYKAYLKKVS